MAGALWAGAGVAVGCSSRTASREHDGSFEFDEPTPLGQIIPVDLRAAAPPVQGELLDGSTFDSSAYLDQVLVVNFWGSWCAPCRVETPEFQAVHLDTVDRGAYFLGVAVKDQRQLAQAFYDDFSITYPSLFDQPGEVALAFRSFPANVVPTTILVDRDGRVAATYVAVVPEADLRSALDVLLAEDPSG